MAKQTTGFTRSTLFVRRARELKTIRAMVRMYCRGHHRGGGEAICPVCEELMEYATRRLERCVFGDAKPTCANCVVHCYSAGMRERVRIVMRWAGPRMLLRHPILGIAHLLDGRRPVPTLPATPAAQALQKSAANNASGSRARSGAAPPAVSEGRPHRE